MTLTCPSRQLIRPSKTGYVYGIGHYSHLPIQTADSSIANRYDSDRYVYVYYQSVMTLYYPSRQSMCHSNNRYDSDQYVYVYDQSVMTLTYPSRQSIRPSQTELWCRQEASTLQIISSSWISLNLPPSKHSKGDFSNTDLSMDKKNGLYSVVCGLWNIIPIGITK